jgi:hypothetical protein
MPQCPTCHAENAAEARFCGECGTRLAPTTPAIPQQLTPPVHTTEGPPYPTGKETVVLRTPDFAPTERPPERQPPATPQPATDATIIAGVPAPPASAPTAQASAATTPTAAFPAPQMGDPGYLSSTLPPLEFVAPQPPSKSSGGRIWLLIALIALLGLGIVAAIIVGVTLIARSVGAPALRPTSVAGGGLARLPTAAPRPTAASAGFGNILLKDNFDNPKSSSLTEDKTDNATYSFVDGAYAINLQTPKYLVWSPLDGSYGDMAIEVDTALDKGPSESAAGLIFRFQDEDNFYFFSVSGEGSYSLDLYKKNDRKTLIDWTDSPAIKGQGKVNHLRVETEGDRIRLFVNDTLLDEISDDSFRKGQVALAVNTFNKGGATFTFDNLIVRGSK